MNPESPHDVLQRITQSLVAYLRALQESGVVGLPASPADSAAAPAASLRQAGTPATVIDPTGTVAVLPRAATRTVQSDGSPLGGADSLANLRAVIGDCRRCRLCEGRTQLVFGVGNPRAELVFVGEGPGHEEDLQGQPFVGRAGRLLTEIITKGMKLSRDEVYITNVVKCRPPDNRDPRPDEVAACEPYLLAQLQLVQPRIIVALGRFAAQTLLKTKTPISRLRGVWHTYHDMKVMPTLHPAYLLRYPKDKSLVWEDIKAVLREMGRR